MEKIIAGCIVGLVVLIIWAGFGLLAAWLLQWAWNLLIPALFGGPSITYLMACAMYFLLSLIGGAFKARVSTSKS